MDIVESQHALFMERGMPRVSPFGVTAIIPSSAANNISMLLGCKGMVVTISNSCTAGLDAIGCAFGRISHGSENVLIAGGADAQITPFGLALLCASQIMSRRNDDPEGASRPFDRTRDGGILSEGVGVLILEEMEHALERGSHIYAEILGYASRADGIGTYEVQASDSGIERAMRLAIQDAGIEPEEVDYICAHAPSDEFDSIETTAIKRVFGEHAYKLPVSSVKSMIGNPLAAAGPLQLIASTMVFGRGVIPPTINYRHPDPDCDLDYVPGKARKCSGINIILINSHGFGGVNSSLIVSSLRSQRGEADGRE
jgi:3-oxoacyl-[acyl-carrier-protein] synthase II